jgi:hypothetical protein
LRFSGEVEVVSVSVCVVLRIDKVGILESIFGERMGFPLSWGAGGEARGNSRECVAAEDAFELVLMSRSGMVGPVRGSKL